MSPPWASSTSLFQKLRIVVVFPIGVVEEDDEVWMTSFSIISLMEPHNSAMRSPLNSNMSCKLISNMLLILEESW